MNDQFEEYYKSLKSRSKGVLSIHVILTDEFQKSGLPSSHVKLLTPNGGQVSCLSGSRLASILNKHGIKRKLASEGGRTSRGSIENARRYLSFLSSLETCNLNDAMLFWIGKVIDHFNSKPFQLNLSTHQTFEAAFEDLFNQARARQKENPGTQYIGALLQHLTGAKIETMTGLALSHNSFTTADEQTGRHGDFDVGTSAIHVTASATEALILKCVENIKSGADPVIVTLRSQLGAVTTLAENHGISDRLSILGISQFLTSNFLEKGHFDKVKAKVAMKEAVVRYNELIEEFETDLSMKIKI